MSASQGLRRSQEHARASRAASEALAAYEVLSQGEHPEVLEDAYTAYTAARAVERRAFIAYTNPFGVDKHA